jgi:L-ribulose-5-phosphate 4-epimerase
MLEMLKQQVWEENQKLCTYGLITLTWGNVSGIDRESGLVVIKPSGISYDVMKPEDMVVVDLQGNRVEGKWNPSSDLPTHLVLYRTYPEIGGIVHTHSRWATIFSQAGRDIPALGTTHADTFYGSVPCTRKLTAEEIAGNYEEQTGNVIVETFADRNVMDVPAVLVQSHGPFTWGKNPQKAVENSVILEEVAMMAWNSLAMNPQIQFQQELLDKHYFRKHGAGAYYGQEEIK